MSQQNNHPALDWLKQTATAEHWKRIGNQACAGVSLPLFSVFSEHSLGIGEIPDLQLVVDWGGKTGMKIIQLLPLNDVGFNFTPYDAQSSFALEPMYLALRQLKGVQIIHFQDDLNRLKNEFPSGTRRVNFQIKRAKLVLLKKIFKNQAWDSIREFTDYKERNVFWLHDYARYKVIKSHYAEKPWWEWNDELAQFQETALQQIDLDYPEELNFHTWLQWQLYEQMKSVQSYAHKKNIFIMGDLPFLVSKDSADVWAHQQSFKLNLSSGAPPDMYFATGQRWGMPPYNWPVIKKQGYDYLIQKLKYSENFYDLFRIDHFVGLFRIWTIPVDSQDDQAGLNGKFDPEPEPEWEEHGKTILNVMLANTLMLPCAEDLGAIPDCSYKAIQEYGITGMDVQRWLKDWGKTFDFKPVEQYRANAIAVLSTHDATDFRTWWEYDAGTVDEIVFRMKCQNRGLDSEWLISQLFSRNQVIEHRLRWKEDITTSEQLLAILNRPYDQVRDFVDMFFETAFEKQKFLNFLGITDVAFLGSLTKELAIKALEKINLTASIFSIQLLQDWLCISDFFKGMDARDFRINTPGTISQKNWTVVMPFSLEQLLANPINLEIRQLNIRTRRWNTEVKCI